MKILQIIPAGKHRRSGNYVTAKRYSRLLHELGHKVETSSIYKSQAGDMLIALHATHSRDAVLEFRSRFPDRPVIVVLTGTDIHMDMENDPPGTAEVLNAADVLVCFHERVHTHIPVAFRSKCYVIFQSASPLGSSRRPGRRYFNVCVVGHLRAVKDPFCTAHAVRTLPRDSRIRVTQLGRALSDEFHRLAVVEMQNNDRYRWLGDAQRWQVRRELARTRLMVISSVAEGGANVISESVMAGVPVVATAIDGNIGLLGDDYSGYFPPRDEAALQHLLLRLEQGKEGLEKLTQQCLSRRHLFTYDHELESWRYLLLQLGT